MWKTSNIPASLIKDNYKKFKESVWHTLLYTIITGERLIWMAQRNRSRIVPAKYRVFTNFWPWLYLCICARERESGARASESESEREKREREKEWMCLQFVLASLSKPDWAAALFHNYSHTHHTHTHTHTHTHNTNTPTQPQHHHTHTHNTHNTHTKPASPLIIIYWLQPVLQGLTWSCYFLLSLLKMCVLSSAHTPHKKSLLKSKGNTFQNNYEMQRALAGNSWVDNLWK